MPLIWALPSFCWCGILWLVTETWMSNRTFSIHRLTLRATIWDGGPACGVASSVSWRVEWWEADGGAATISALWASADIQISLYPSFFFIFSNYTPKLIHQHFQVTHYTRRHQATRLLNDNCGCKEFRAFSFAVCAVVCVKRKLDLKCV